MVIVEYFVNCAMSEISRLPAGLRDEFVLDRRVTYLNHGSYGATPKRILDAQTAWREQMELEPVRFMSRELPPLLRTAASKLGDYVGADGSDIVFVSNATSGVNSVLQSLDLKPGDEILMNSQTYNAVKQAITFLCRRTGAVIVTTEVPFPMADEDAVVAAQLSKLSDRTRFAIFDHVTSPTAYVMPVHRLVSVCRARGVRVMVDGAHALGMLPIDLRTLDADYYTGNAHKWLCAPKGAAFLYVRRELQDTVHPTVISHFLDEGFLREFDWTGTQDFSAFLSVTAALEWRQHLGDEAVRTHNHTLVCEAAAMLRAREVRRSLRPRTTSGLWR